MFWDEQAAYDYETEVIAGHGLENLTNIMAGGQRAFERRVRELKVRKRKEPTVLEIFKKGLPHILNWFKLTDGGKYKVTADRTPTGSKFYDMIPNLAEKMYNDIIGRCFKESFLKDDKDKEEIEKILNSHGLSLGMLHGG